MMKSGDYITTVLLLALLPLRAGAAGLVVDE